MNKRIIITIFILLLIFQPTVSFGTEEESQIIESQIKELEIDKLINKIEKNTDNDMNLKEVFQNAIKGRSSGNLLINLIEIVLGQELKACFKIMISIFLVIIIYGVLKNLSSNLGNDQTGKIGNFIQLIILITLLLRIYTQIIEIVTQTINTLSNIIYTLLPLFISLNIATGNITSSTGIQSIILIATNFITYFINQILIPIIIIATALGIISNISDEMSMKKISKYMKSIVIWGLCIFLTIFTCILSLESNLGKGVDELASKTTKTAVSTLVPVVGKILGDTVDSVLGCTNIIKNAVGSLGIFAVLAISIAPLIKIGITCIFIYLLSGLAEVVADEKIVYVLEQMGDSCKVLLASVSSVVVMLIIGFTITMKIGISS